MPAELIEIDGNGVAGCEIWLRSTARVIGAAGMLALMALGNPAGSESGRGWTSSPFHRQLNGDGRVIPCRCRFDGREFRLDDTACIRGVRMRCDLLLNNTTWIPTDEACDPRLSQAASVNPG